jgi:hypothetical protein
VAESLLILRDGNAEHTLRIGSRDLGLLLGRGFDAGSLFLQAFGVYECYTVAGGIPKGAQVTRRGNGLRQAASALHLAVESDLDLLRWNYTYSFGDEKSRHAGGYSGFRIRGRFGHIETRPRGYCYVELTDYGSAQPRVAECIDMRVVRRIATDESGLLKVHRRMAKTQWLERLPPLITFLSAREHAGIVIEVVD